MKKVACVKTSVPDPREFTLILLSWTRIGIGNTDPDPDA
jgi:hypothetical protein